MRGKASKEEERKDARDWLIADDSPVSSVCHKDAQAFITNLLRRRMMRFRRGELSFDPLQYLHDHCDFGDFCGLDGKGEPTLYPRACTSSQLFLMVSIKTSPKTRYLIQISSVVPRTTMSLEMKRKSQWRQLDPRKETCISTRPTMTSCC